MCVYGLLAVSNFGNTATNIVGTTDCGKMLLIRIYLV
jgi:hypothetical protein